MSVCPIPGNVHCAELLIAVGACLEAYDLYYGTPLHMACVSERMDCVKVLLNAGELTEPSLSVLSGLRRSIGIQLFESNIRHTDPKPVEEQKPHGSLSIFVATLHSLNTFSIRIIYKIKTFIFILYSF